MTPRSFIFFDEQGAIYRHTSGVSEVFEGPGIMEVTDEPFTNFFACYITEEGSVAERPVMPLEVTQNPFSVTGIPVGTQVIYPGGSLIVDDGFLEWDAIEPGKYPFRFTNFPYQEVTLYAEIADI